MEFVSYIIITIFVIIITKYWLKYLIKSTSYFDKLWEKIFRKSLDDKYYEPVEQDCRWLRFLNLLVWSFQGASWSTFGICAYMWRHPLDAYAYLIPTGSLVISLACALLLHLDHKYVQAQLASIEVMKS